MKDSFTLNDFILYLTSYESQDDEKMIEAQSKICENDLTLPDKRIIGNILSYSRALSVLKTKGVGNFNLLMN